MNRSFPCLAVAAALPLLATLFTAEARAQGVPPPPPAAPPPAATTTTTVSPYAPPTTTTTVTSPAPVVAPAPVVGVTEPMPVEEAPPTTMRETTTSQSVGPSWPMVASGLVIFGLSYAPAVIVGGTSSLDADQRLYVPVVGPWLDLGQRPSCNNGDCNAENTARVGLVVDGVFQGIGVLTTLGGFLFTSHETSTVQTTAEAAKPTVHFSPSKVGTGYGMGAVGTF